MAALSSSSSVASVSLASHASVVTPRRRGNNPVTTTSSLQRPSLTLNSSGIMSNAFPIKRRDTRVSAVDPGTPPGPDPLGRNLPIPGLPGIPVPQWAQWLVGAIFFAVPLYRQFRAMEDKIEKTTEVAIEVIDMVAEETEKIADEVADSMPGNKTLKAAAAKIKAVADEIEEDADKAKALIEKADEIEKEMDSIVDSLIDNKKGGKKKP